jgi:hypothetical protein
MELLPSDGNNTSDNLNLYPPNNRSKFQTVTEALQKTNSHEQENTEDMNSDEDINTENMTSSNSRGGESGDAGREFSVSTLDRKLKQIRKNKMLLNKKSLRQLGQKKMIASKISSEKYNNNTNLENLYINPAKLINQHLHEIQLRTIGHNRAAVMYERNDKIIGFPITLISSFTTSTIMMSLNVDEGVSQNIIKYIGLILSITSLLFSISRDYLNFSKKFQSHDLSSKLYTTLLRSMEVRLIKNHLTDDERRDMFKDIIDQMSIIEQYETPVPAFISARLANENDIMNISIIS